MTGTPLGHRAGVVSAPLAPSDLTGPGDAAGRSPRVSVVIPNWNGRAFLGTCLEALRAQSSPPAEIFLVDNGSRDGSLELVRARYPDVRIIAFPENRGFSVAVNAGIRASSGAYVALLNNDTQVDPRWLEASVAALEAQPEFSVCAAKMINHDRPTEIDAIGVGCIAGGFGYSIGAFEADRGQYDAPREVFGACAGAAVYRRDAFAQVGEFEEAFFAYYEDVDWDFRAQAAGLRTLYVPSAVVRHVRGGSISEDRVGWRLRLAARNRWYVILRNLPLRLLLLGSPRMLVYEGLWVAQLCRRGQLRDYLAGMREVAAALPELRRARRLLRAQRRIGVGDLRRRIAASERLVLDSMARRSSSPFTRRVLRLVRHLV